MTRIVCPFFICNGVLLTVSRQIDSRALFERVIPNVPLECARPLWERWAQYEYQYGDLEASLKLEKRMAEVYASGTYPFLSIKFGSSQYWPCFIDSPIKRLAQRHMHFGTDVIATRDLGFAIARRGII
jgi:cleavage stimulation factor subunit 3